MHLATLLGAEAPPLAPALDGIRLTLHVLAAAIWVGGQCTMAGLVPTARSISGDAPKKLAGTFAKLLWPAYAVLVITGFWNISAIAVGDESSAWKSVLVAKVVVVVAAGVAVFLHQRATTKRGLAVWGALGGLFSVAALVLGVFLAG